MQFMIIIIISSFYFATQVYTQTVKFLLKSVILCKFTAWCTDVLADKLHPRFDTKIFEQKGAAYKPVCTV